MLPNAAAGVSATLNYNAAMAAASDRTSITVNSASVAAKSATLHMHADRFNWLYQTALWIGGRWINPAIKGMVEGGASAAVTQTLPQAINELLRALPGSINLSIPGLSVSKLAQNYPL